MTEPVSARLFPAFTAVEKGKTYYWCSCGLSAKQPFCDGAHKGTPFTPVKYEATETKRVLFCMCKKTGNAPLCDKTHIKVATKTHGSKIAVVAALGAAIISGVAYQIFSASEQTKKSSK
eukprot:CAMPEP_0113670154 /NCGR_PEP_ID=MMETSP0038_2-20120614/4978_1 /TAXON_ID=2898 /ORGANISM="Cryptomonas paramecium" /LENGTH=118 /DNA_ID=CAMNT_0000586137 /DNA_START=10 /DNA_END=366 /DNA_ORIENTATION=+ /assembly_acc=CAM_ASM_000170